MSSFHQVLIGGYSGGGLVTDRKPLMLPDQAFSNLQNAYVWRERTKKRIGNVSMGQLRRDFSSASIGNSSVSGGIWTIDTIYSNLTGESYFPITPETYAEIVPGSVSIFIVTLAHPFVDQGNGILTNATAGNSGTIDYLTGEVVLTTTIGSGHAATITFGYYPSLPVMGICKQDITTQGVDNTIFFDTTYAYQFVTGSFQEIEPGVTWSGSNTDFFWTCNYQGADADVRLFFATNNNITLGESTPYDPIRYLNASTWTDLKPLITATRTLYQALIVIPYYGRLIALNTWEGTTVGGVSGATNFYARARFSQIGDPTQIGTTGPYVSGSWATDVFGKGGFLDAPTNESIVSAAFYRNTLIVFFEYSTWQLRYVGEYGLPFIFERISSDFGSSATYSSIVFDEGVMTVSDRGIIQAGASGLKRLDEQIPETVFSFEIQNDAPNFVHGVRDFEKELVYWNYVDESQADITQQFPTTVLLYNYRNNTWAQFRDTITCFGIGQFAFGITWNSFTTFWESDVNWDDSDDQSYTDYVVAGNQQGYISIYENLDASTEVPQITNFCPTLSITAVDFSTSPTQFTVPNHNLATGEIIYITGALWNGTDPGINNKIYRVSVYNPNSMTNYNTITLSIYSIVTGEYTDLTITSSATYIGGGEITLFPKMNIVGKDFSPFQSEGIGYKLSYIDFQMDTSRNFPSIPAVTVQLFVNSFLGEQANLLTGNMEVSNASQQVGQITFATQTNPCQVTSPNHCLINNKIIAIKNVTGMTELNVGSYTITVVDSNNFTLNGIDATGFTAYSGGGIWNALAVQGQIYISGSQYAWYRFYSTQFGQYLRIALTYDDLLMNQLATHQTPMELNAMNCWMRKGGRLIQ